MDLLMGGLSSLVMIEYFKTFFEKRKIKAMGCILWMIHYFWQIVAVYILADFPSWMRMGLGIFCILLSGCFFNGHFGVKIILTMLYIAMSVLGEALVGCCFLMVGISPETHMSEGAVISELFLLLFVKALQLFFCNPMIRKLSWKYNVSFLFLPLSSMFLVNYIFSISYELKQTGYRQMTALGIIVLFLMNLVVFHLYIRLAESMELKYRNAVYQKEFELLEAHRKEQEDVVIAFRRKKHDLKHQVVWILQLLKEEKYDELRETVKKMADFGELEKKKISDTGNSIVDAFVNYKYEVAKKSGIAFRVQLNIPSELPFAGGDLCMILGNALDNALEANQRGTVENPYIDLKMKYDIKNLVIVLENSFDGTILEQQSGERMTRKTDWENHGIGISSIKDILKKYNGYYDTFIQGTTYRLNMILYENSMKKEED